MVLQELERAIHRLDLAGRRVLVAVSGGVDSTVLAAGLAELARLHRLELAIGHVNHGLRGAESQADEHAVCALAEKLGVRVAVETVDPHSLRSEGPSRDRPTLQEAARTLRRRALAEMLCELDSDHIVTAHHADDQAETVLMRLLRGSGPDGLAGIPERSQGGAVVRPLLKVTRADILAYANEQKLDWREDASNADAKYTRNRLRRDWLPALARDFNPQLLRAIGDLAEAQRRDTEWLESLVETEALRRFCATPRGISITADGWQTLPEALARRLARHAIVTLGGGRELSRVHLMRMLDFLRTGRVGAAIELPVGLRLERRREGFELRRPDPPPLST
jgi:tRNA(Ile)-lysidine synthase